MTKEEKELNETLKELNLFLIFSWLGMVAFTIGCFFVAYKLIKFSITLIF
jgi:hypothetical protein